MSNQYTQPSVSNYNAAPPPDDGSHGGSNVVAWATIKSKLADPLLSFANAINSAISTAFALNWLNSFNPQSAPYSVAAADRGKLLSITGTTTVTLLAAATAGSGFALAIKNSGVGVVTVAPNGTEHIDNSGGSITLSPGTGISLACDGTQWAITGTAGFDRWAVAGGAADAITLTNTPPLAGLVDGQLIFFRALAANATTTPTVAIDGLSPTLTITKQGGSAVAASDIPAAGAEIVGRVRLSTSRLDLLNPAASFAGGTLTATLTMNGAAINEARGSIASAATMNIGAATANYLQVTGTTGVTAFDTVQAGTERTLEFASTLTITNSANIINAGGVNITTYGGMVLKYRSEGAGVWRQVTADPSGPALAGLVGGLALSNDGSLPNTTIDIAAGFAVADDLSVVMRSAAFTKTTGAWAVGTGNGGLDTGAVANSTWYHVFQIMRPDTGVVDFLISTSATAPTMPSNYTKKRRIGSFKTDGSAHIVAYTQFGKGNARRYIWAATVQDQNGQAVANGSTTTFTMGSVPSGINVDGIFHGVFTRAGGTAAGSLWSGAQGSSANPPDSNLACNVSGIANNFSMILMTDTSQHIYATCGGASCTISIDTEGWIDYI